MPGITKEQVLRHCQEMIDGQIAELSSEIAKLEESAANETKSSMGDKYETGREMMMQEKVKLNERLQLLKNHKVALNAVDDTTHELVKLGSLVRTSQATFFIVSAIGNVTVKGTPVFVISQAAPLAREMMGKREGEEVQFNGRAQQGLAVS